MKFTFQSNRQAERFATLLSYVLDQTIYHEIQDNVLTTCELDEQQRAIASDLYRQDRLYGSTPRQLVFLETL